MGVFWRKVKSFNLSNINCLNFLTHYIKGNFLSVHYTPKSWPISFVKLAKAFCTWSDESDDSLSLTLLIDGVLRIFLMTFVGVEFPSSIFSSGTWINHFKIAWCKSNNVVIMLLFLINTCSFLGSESVFNLGTFGRLVLGFLSSMIGLERITPVSFSGYFETNCMLGNHLKVILFDIDLK